MAFGQARRVVRIAAALRFSWATSEAMRAMAPVIFTVAVLVMRAQERSEEMHDWRWLKAKNGAEPPCSENLSPPLAHTSMQCERSVGARAPKVFPGTRSDFREFETG